MGDCCARAWLLFTLTSRYVVTLICIGDLRLCRFNVDHALPVGSRKVYSETSPCCRLTEWRECLGRKGALSDSHDHLGYIHHSFACHIPDSGLHELSNLMVRFRVSFCLSVTGIVYVRRIAISLNRPGAISLRIPIFSSIVTTTEDVQMGRGLSVCHESRGRAGIS